MKRKKRHIKAKWDIIQYETITDESFSWLLLPSVLGILLCCFCLAGLTWAWFSNSVTSSANNITTASFAVDISVKTNGTELTPTEENGKYTYTLTAGTTYAVTVTADNTATATTGYCTVKLKSSDNNEKTYHTVQLYPAGGDGKPQSVQFTVNSSDIPYLTITPQWGTYAKQDGEALIGKSEEDINTIPIPSLLHLESETEETEKAEETQANQPTEPQKNYETPKTATSQPETTESTVSEPSATEPSTGETPKQTEESSSSVSTESSLQETESEETTASETQTVPNTGTTVAETNEP